jgi:hypothetical protein
MAFPGEAGVILTINQNPRAPIFKAADYGIVGDWREFLPPLIAPSASSWRYRPEPDTWKRGRLTVWVMPMRWASGI